MEVEPIEKPSATPVLDDVLRSGLMKQGKPYSIWTESISSRQTLFWQVPTGLETRRPNVTSHNGQLAEPWILPNPGFLVSGFQN